MAYKSRVSDVMSDVLSLIRMRSEIICPSEMYSPWSLAFQNPTSHFHIVVRGIVWLSMAGRDPIRLGPGDLAILPLGVGHVLSSDPTLEPVPLEKALANADSSNGTIFRIEGAGDLAEIVCGRFTFAGVLAKKLLSVLPPLIHIEGFEGRPLEWLRLTSHFLVDEAQNPRPGSAVMIERLLDLLFIQAIRVWGARSPGNLGWLSGLRDPAIGRALSAIHDDPGRSWTVEALAELAGLSRSAFAARFTDVVGQTPLKYVATWRLDLAADQLRAGTSQISEIAANVGYGSEAALTRAFKVQFGTTPAAFRRAPSTVAMEQSTSHHDF